MPSTSDNTADKSPTGEAGSLLQEGGPYLGQLTPLELSALEGLLSLLNTAFMAEENAAQVQGQRGRAHSIDAQWFDSMADSLTRLEELPADKPGARMPVTEKARWALRRLLEAAPAPAPADTQKTSVNDFAKIIRTSDGEQVLFRKGETEDGLPSLKQETAFNNMTLSVNINFNGGAWGALDHAFDGVNVAHADAIRANVSKHFD